MTSIAAQASQAAAQGQQMLQNDQNNAAQYKGQYSNYQQQADAANQDVKNYTNYMQGAGSAGNQYHNEFQSQLGQSGYNQGAMNDASNAVNQDMAAIGAARDYANTAGSKFGMNAGALAAFNANAQNSLNNALTTHQNTVSQLLNKFTAAQTGANQFTGNVIQGEHETMAGLQNVYTNAADQRDQAAKMMSFYDDLARQQGGMNAQQAQNYAQAQQAYAAANYALAQAAQVNQQVQFMNDARNKYGLASALGIQPSSPVANQGSSSSASSHPGFMNRLQGDLGEGALNLGRWGWTDTNAKAFSLGKNLLGHIF